MTFEEFDQEYVLANIHKRRVLFESIAELEARTVTDEPMTQGENLELALLRIAQDHGTTVAVLLDALNGPLGFEVLDAHLNDDAHHEVTDEMKARAIEVAKRSGISHRTGDDFDAIVGAMLCAALQKGKQDG